MIDPKKLQYTDQQLLSIRNYLMDLARLNIQIILAAKEKMLNKKEKQWKK